MTDVEDKTICGQCGQKKKQLLTSFYCPNCDDKTAAKEKPCTQDGGDCDGAYGWSNSCKRDCHSMTPGQQVNVYAPGLIYDPIDTKWVFDVNSGNLISYDDTFDEIWYCSNWKYWE